MRLGKHEHFSSCCVWCSPSLSACRAVVEPRLHMVQFDEEDKEFGEDFLSDEDPSILHFLLAGGDEVCRNPTLLT